MAIEGDKIKTASRRLLLGMVGGGEGAFIGGVHRIASRIDDRYELVAGAFSSDVARSKSSAAALLVSPDRAYASFEEMASREKARPDRIDVVAIVTPNHLHVPIAKAFLEAGIHVICDKPLTTNLKDAEALAAFVKRTGLGFCLTHNYTGYPLIRQAREMVRAGALGRLRVIQAEYPQDWLSTKLEATGQKQALWRTDPAQSGPVGSLGDLGTHAYNLIRFITGLELDAVAADFQSFVEGRRVEDNAHLMLRFKGGARGLLWASQCAPGNANNLKIRFYGESGGLEWAQENPNLLIHSPLGEQPRVLSRGGAGLGGAAGAATRIPPGHPEGYLEGFAQLYRDFAEQLSARIENRAPEPMALLTPTVDDGVDGVRFVSRAVESNRQNGVWVAY